MKMSNSNGEPTYAITTPSRSHSPSPPLAPQRRMYVGSRQHARQIGTNAEIRHLIADVVEAVRHACRHDDDVAGRDATAIAASERPAGTRPDREPHELGLRRKPAIVLDGAAGHERRAAGDDVEHFGDLRVTDRADRSAGARRGAMQHADAEPVG